MSTTTLELNRFQQTNETNGFDGFDELDAFDGISSIVVSDDTQIIEAIAAEREYLECADYDSAWY